MKKRRKTIKLCLMISLLMLPFQRATASEERRELPMVIHPDSSIGEILDRNEQENPLFPTPDPEEPEKGDYKIIYELDKGKNHPSNPSFYQAGDSWQLKKPSRKGYLFAGWYSDKQLTQKADRITEEDTGKKYFYAKWKKLSVPKIRVLRVNSKKAGKLTVNLPKVKGAKGYQIQIFRDQKLQKLVGKASLKKQTGYFSKLPKGNMVYVRARCYMADSTGKIMYGAYSKAVKVKIRKGTEGKS